MKTRKYNSSKTPSATPASVTTAAGIKVNGNPNRLSLLLQNTGTEPILLRFGGTASATNYNIILAADSAAKAGLGGSVEIDDYVGYISAIVEANTSTLAITELTVN